MIILLLTMLLSFSRGQSVCGYDGLDYPSSDAAHANDTGVMHCESCGKCSNIHDISIYKRMADNLTGVTTYCTVLSLVGMGRSCMNKRVGFTSDCMDCWIENMKCSRKHCAAVCLFGRQSESDDGKLNKCLQCDEDKCGPAFKKCAGANRRRCGIVTDISRTDDQMCKIVDPFPIDYFMIKQEERNVYDQYDADAIPDLKKI